MEKNGQTGSDPNGKMLKPIIKVMALSTRPQRYDKCHLKEGDALMTMDLPQIKKHGEAPQLPIRIVMNNKSFAVFQDETMETNLATFLLSRTAFRRLAEDKNCFMLLSQHTQAKFCKLDSGIGDFVNEWDYDFNLFKRQCKVERPSLQLEDYEEEKLQEEYNEKVKEAKGEIVRKREDTLKEKVQETDEKKLEKTVEKTEATTLQAVRKEFKLEEMLEREEEEREARETKEIELEIEKEKAKDECLLTQIQEKEKEDQYNISLVNAQDSIKSLTKEAQIQIETKRAEIKRKILSMRKKNKRRKAALQSQLMSLRTEVSDKLQKINKAGKIENCFAQNFTIKNIKEVETYCTNNFNDDFAKLENCKDPKNFCYTCCENEFGEVHVKLRDSCYKKCDGANKGEGNDSGKWVWSPEIK